MKPGHNEQREKARETDEPANQRIQVSSTWPIFLRELGNQRIRRHAGEKDRGGGVGGVKRDQHQELADSLAVGPGSEPKSAATLRTTGKMMPPPRAVSDGMNGASTTSAAAME